MTAEGAAAAPLAGADRGVLGALSATDHKSVALRTVAASLAFFAAGGVLALLMRTELARPGLQVVSTDLYNQLFTMHGSTMVYLVVTPIALALGAYLVPLQVGAPELVAPRLNLFALWLLVLGGVMMYAGFLTQGGAAADGWTAFLPLADETYTPGPAMDMWLWGVVLATLAAIVLAGTVLGTILLRRTPGMTMLRIPVFAWTMVVTCLMVLLSFPALVAALTLVWADRHLGVDVDPVVYQHLFWFYGHPAVYVMFFPYVGAVAEVIAVFAGRRFFGYRAMVFSLLAFTSLSMSVWGHHMFTTGAVANTYYSLTSTALLVVAGVEYFDFVGTLWGGVIRLRTPMLFALGFVLQFVIGGVTGVIVASPTLDYHLNDTYFVVAHFHYTLFAGSLFGLFAGIYYWFPKATGRMLREGLGRLHFWLLVIGTNLTFFPMFVLGADGMPRRVADYPESTGWGALNLVETAGAAIVALAMLVFVANVVAARVAPVRAGDDPWGGHTLEWATSSPPPRYNFDRPLPAVRSYAPLLDLRDGAAR